MQTTLVPPNAKKIPVEISTKHGDVRLDNYQWLKDKNNPEVIEYLTRENCYADDVMLDVKPLHEKIYSEIIARIKEDDVSAPYKKGDYMYYHKTEKGKSYPIYFRKKIGSIDEEMILDVNEIAEGLKFCFVMINPSPDNNILAYSVDTKGDHFASIYFKDLKTGKLLDEHLEKVGMIEWVNDSKTIYYVRFEKGNMGKQLFRHNIADKQVNDKLIHEEKDDAIWIYPLKSSSKKYIFLYSGTFNEEEVYYTDADNSEGEFKLIEKRTIDLKYTVEHNGDKFYILTNYDAPDYRIMTAPVENPSKENWKEFIPERNSIKIEGMQMFKDYLVIMERDFGLNKYKITDIRTNKSHYINFPEPIYMTFPEYNYEFDTKYFRYAYSSFITPMSFFDHDMEKNENILLKETEVPGGYKKEDYVTERRFAPSHDNKIIPISLVYKKGISIDGKNPLFMMSYGSYGYSSEAWFSPSRLSLLERGFIFAVAHIRGGGELGEQWYKEGKLLNKKNTFLDFISCSEYLIKEGFTYAGGISAIGASAGGILMGAIANMRPELFKCIIAKVPASDTLNSLEDSNVENAKVHFGEQGDPDNKEHYYYMKSYSPYENIKEIEYPNMYITTGLHDVNVPFWEPAKYTAKLREYNKGNNIILFRTRMDSAHMGPSGRYEVYKEIAYDFTFAMKCYGILN